MKYENIYQSEEHFSFGRNWSDFQKRKLDESSIKEAEKSLLDFFDGHVDVRGKSFLDVGSGSGLFSLAATRLGVSNVVSTDVDEWSVRCTDEVRTKYAPQAKWQVRHASVLDREQMSSLGQFDVVYSWGVLHHTGEMWQAIENTGHLVRTGGWFYLALYNTSNSWLEGTSVFWVLAKRHYNRVGQMHKRVYKWLYVGYMICGLASHGINPIRYIKNYTSLRGMDYFTDIEDWLGGDPYEHATVEEVEEYLKTLGFDLVKTKKARNIGCNEFLFRKFVASS